MSRSEENDLGDVVAGARTRGREQLAQQQAEFDYEFPPIAEDPGERMENALNYHYTRGWNINKASTKAGVNYGALKRAIDNVGVARKPGRPNKITNEKLAGVRDEIDHRTRHLDAVRADDQLEELLVDAAVQSNTHVNNSVAEAALKENGRENVMCRTTLWSYKKKLEVVEVEGADVKSESRAKQFEEIRNPMSLCAVLQHLDGIVDPEHYHSSDDVSVLLNGWEKPRVVTTREAQTFLAQMNIGVSVTEAEMQRRVVTFNVTIAADSTLTCSVAKFKDHAFVDFKEKPEIFDMGDDFYVCCYHTSCPDETVAMYMYRMCIQKVAKRKRTESVERDLGGLEGAQLHLTQSSHASSGGDREPQTRILQESDEEIHERHKYCAFALDGAHPQIAAILNSLNDDQIRKFLYYLYVKYAGGCSLSESPNDQGRMHNIMHNQFSSPDYKYDPEPCDPRGKVWADLKKMLQRTLSAPSFATFWHCLTKAKDFLNKAFTRLNIQSAFKKSGVQPFVPEKILSKCPAFCEMSEEDALFVIGTIPEMAKLVENTGMVSEEDFVRIFATRPDCPQPTLKESGKPLNEMSTNRQRAMIINNNTYLADLAKRKTVLEAKKTGAAIPTATCSTSSARKRVLTDPPTTALDLFSLVLQSDDEDVEKETNEPVIKRARTAPRTFCFHCHRMFIEENEESEPWVACKVGRCKKIYCNDEVCQTALREHRAVCASK